MRTTQFMPALYAALTISIAGCGAAPPASPGPARPPPAAGAPGPKVDEGSLVNEQGDAELAASPGLEGALDRYRKGDMEAAAASFYAILEAPAGHSTPDLAAAQFFAAKALARRGYRVASLSFFGEIGRDPTHRYFDRTLFWLAHLADELPEDEPVLRLLSRYLPNRLDSGAPSQPQALVESALYYRGRAYYQQRDFDRAIRLLRGVPAGSRWAVYARFFEGVSQLRSADPDAAATSFEAAVREAARAPGVEEAARLRDLAWISLARVHYSKAKAETDEVSLAGGEALRLALEAYGRVSDDGGFQDDARLEQAWALVRLGDTGRALASLDRISAPYAEATPEVHYLRSYVHFARCEIDKAAATIEAFRQAYGRASALVERLGREAGDAARDPASTQASPVLHAVVTSALAQRDVRRIFELLSVIKGEKELLAAAPPAFQSSPLGARIFRELEQASAAASDRITESVKKRCDRFAQESREELWRAEMIELEIESIRGGLSTCAPPKKAPLR